MERQMGYLWNFKDSWFYYEVGGGVPFIERGSYLNLQTLKYHNFDGAGGCTVTDKPLYEPDIYGTITLAAVEIKSHRAFHEVFASMSREEQKAWYEGKVRSREDMQWAKAAMWAITGGAVAGGVVYLASTLAAPITKAGAELAYSMSRRGAAKIGMKAIEAGEYTITNTGANNLATRPYINSPSSITNIMKSGSGMPDAFFKGGMNYRVPGAFNSSTGIFELGINPKNKYNLSFSL